ncbi:CPBP family intramembrane glutamic endopeptidase [uncultured Anaerococcus sp.]|uniref:CPBP family intramembrane glutamic endopeptidase n=1 Tax=uncultured Anaerococcus sp. TaxID=293428 RepID=UPI0026109D95|nr:type II CAAX endopeptidase family protein [uncultured Anaerococcus sp.]
MNKLVKTIAKVVGFFVVWLALSVLIPIPDIAADARWRFMAELVPLFAIIIVTYILYKIEKDKFPIFPVNKSAKEIVLAIIAGLAWFFLPFLTLKVFGFLEITNTKHVDMLYLWILSAFINTIMQELLARGYIYQLIKSKFSIRSATIVTTLVFTLMHGGAFEAGLIAILNVVTMSLLMTIILEYTNSLLVPIIMHFIWNTLGGIIFGTVSLASDYPHIYNMKIHGNQIISGGPFKMEGSIFVFAINIIMIAIVYKIYKKKRDQLYK